MIDVKRETTLRLTQVPDELSSRPHVATVWRWCLRGVRGVKLESLVVGGVRYTSHEAIERFLARLNGQPQPPPPERAAREAGERLARKGA